MDDFAKQLQEQEKALENIRHKLAFFAGPARLLLDEES